MLRLQGAAFAGSPFTTPSLKLRAQCADACGESLRSCNNCHETAPQRIGPNASAGASIITCGVPARHHSQPGVC